MPITNIIPQLRATDLPGAIRFYTEKLGFSVEFNYQDCYAGIRFGGHVVHLKAAEETDPSIAYVEEAGHLHLYFEMTDVADLAAQLKQSGVALVKDVHETAWNTREFVIHDDQGHTLYFGEPLCS